jgi:hypothetical protein
MLITTPSNDLCGDLTYTSTFAGTEIDSDSDAPIQYSADSLTHTVYSEDITLIDTTDNQNIK